MEENQTPKDNETPEEFPDKVYPFRFSSAMLAVLILLLALCAAGFGITTWQFLGFLRGGELGSVYEWLKYILLYLVSLLLAVLVVAMLIRSRYTVTSKELILRFGLIRSKYALKSIFSVKLFKSTGKLTVYFDDFKTKYMVIVVKEEWYDDFIQTLLERNGHMEIDFSPEETNKKDPE